MKLRSFKEYLEKRLDPKEISEIHRQANLEFEVLKSLQNDISGAIEKYMQEENIGFNELVRRLDVSPAQINKMQKGEANITLASLAHIAALFNKRAYIVFKDKKS